MTPPRPEKKASCDRRERPHPPPASVKAARPDFIRAGLLLRGGKRGGWRRGKGDEDGRRGDEDGRREDHGGSESVAAARRALALAREETRTETAQSPTPA